MNVVSGAARDSFDVSLVGLLGDLVSQASSGDQFSVGTTNSSSRTIYGLLQCTPDLSTSECNSCLEDCVGNLPDCCYGREGARVLKPSCSLMYETYPFFNSTAVTPHAFSRYSSTKSSGKISIAITQSIATYVEFLPLCFVFISVLLF